MACSSIRCPPPTPLTSHSHHIPLNRRSLIFLSTTLPLSTPLTSSAGPLQPDTTITDRVFLDFSVCPSYFLNRTLGEYDLSLCEKSEPLGRLVLGLYGNLVPITVSNFKSMCNGSSGSTYKGTLVQKILPGQFFTAGRQGRRDKGEVKPPVEMVRNTESVDSKAFLLEHSRPGVVSLCLSENDDDDDLKLSPDYHNVEFLQTLSWPPPPTQPYRRPTLQNPRHLLVSILPTETLTRIPSSTAKTLAISLPSLPTVTTASRFQIFRLRLTTCSVKPSDEDPIISIDGDITRFPPQIIHHRFQLH